MRGNKNPVPAKRVVSSVLIFSWIKGFHLTLWNGVIHIQTFRPVTVCHLCLRSTKSQSRRIHVRRGSLVLMIRPTGINPSRAETQGELVGEMGVGESKGARKNIRAKNIRKLLSIRGRAKYERKEELFFAFLTFLRSNVCSHQFSFWQILHEWEGNLKYH